MSLRHAKALLVGQSPELSTHLKLLFQEHEAQVDIVDEAIAALSRIEKEEDAYAAIIIGAHTGPSMTPIQLASEALTYYGGLVTIIFIGASAQTGANDPDGTDRLSEPIKDSELLGCVYQGIDRIDTALNKPEDNSSKLPPGSRLH
ncbi:MAG: hypothetical protein WBD34_24940 [Burkholderiaceae bacterium]